MLPGVSLPRPEVANPSCGPDEACCDPWRETAQNLQTYVPTIGPDIGSTALHFARQPPRSRSGRQPPVYRTDSDRTSANLVIRTSQGATLPLKPVANLHHQGPSTTTVQTSTQSTIGAAADGVAPIRQVSVQSRSSAPYRVPQAVQVLGYLSTPKSERVMDSFLTMLIGFLAVAHSVDTCCSRT